MNVQEFISNLEKVKQTDNGWTALCPAHDDHNPSLSIGEGDDGRILLHCFAGCPVEDVVASLGLTMKDLFVSSVPYNTKLTVSALAADKGLLEDWLQDFRLEDHPRGVLIPYYLEDGTLAPRQRLRTALKAKDGSCWLGETGISTVPYGLWRLETMRKTESYLVLVEGESDCWTLWCNSFPALGISGATMAHVLQVSHIARLKRIYVFQESDDSGKTFIVGIQERLSELNWEGETYLIKPPEGIKDVNDLYKSNPDNFEKEFQKLIDQSQKLLTLQNNNKDSKNSWEHIVDMPIYLQEREKQFQGLAKDLVASGSITFIASPRGLGKTLVAECLAVELAKGGCFRSEKLESVRVLYIDAENPPSIVKSRFKAFGAENASNLQILDKRHAPRLTDKSAWEKFPSHNFDVLIIDSVGASTPGVTEREGKETTNILGTLLSLTGNNLAIVLLSNTVKSGGNYRGRGEWADRVDILYEVRDATDFNPSGKKPWWQELPDAGEDSWAERAARRKGKTSFRLAFVCSKYRIGIEPDPFCLEVSVSEITPWDVKDVTHELVYTVEKAEEEQKTAKTKLLQKASEDLLAEIKEKQEDIIPFWKTDAEKFLQKEGRLSIREARTLIKDGEGKLWKVEQYQDGKKKGRILKIFSA